MFGKIYLGGRIVDTEMLPPALLSKGTPITEAGPFIAFWRSIRLLLKEFPPFEETIDSALRYCRGEVAWTSVSVPLLLLLSLLYVDAWEIESSSSSVSRSVER